MQTNGRKKPRIVVAGAGIAGSLVLSGLRERADCELIGLERVEAHEHGEAGTGLNIGPNAIKALRAFLPREAEAIVSNSLPWAVYGRPGSYAVVPVKSPFDQVHLASGFDWVELGENPVFGGRREPGNSPD